MQTKQKARLTARHQQAMSTHLGHVIETTEKYTMWLTEGIAGAKQNSNSDLDTSEDKEAGKEDVITEPDNESDVEFVVSVCR